ncbi:MAG: hypothetical protein WDO56_18075 [Gammaproteobacteria bacterium]
MLTHLASAVVRTEGLAELTQTLSVAARWLDSWGGEVFPRVAEDAILRRNALNGFADRMAVVDGVRRAPILSHPQLGPLSIRDIEVCHGSARSGRGASRRVMDEAQINGLLAASTLEDLQALSGRLDEAIRSLESIEESMRSQGWHSGRTGIRCSFDATRADAEKANE